MPYLPIRRITAFHWLLAITAVAALLLLSACTTPAQRTQTRASPAPIVAAPLEGETEAERLSAAGDDQAAAQLWMEQAALASPPQAEQLRLKAATALLDDQQWDAAEQILTQLPPTGSVDYQAALTIQQARLQIARNQAQAALLRLSSLDDTVPSAMRPDYHRTRAEAYAAAGNHLESARERVWLDGLLDPTAQADNHQAIWDTLSQIPDAILHSLRSAPPPDVFSGWMELVETARAQRDSPQELDLALNIWRERYAGHPAIPDFVARLAHHVSASVQPAQAGQIGVLLPLTGNLAEAGQALRDGILAAYHGSASPASAPISTPASMQNSAEQYTQSYPQPAAQPSSQPSTQLRFYDTGSDTEQVTALYQRAIAEGAQQVIGPLTKEAVAKLAELGTLPVPVLALNTLDGTDSPPAQLYQYSLAPEDEARQVAERAWQDGHRQALVLMSEGTWSERLLEAFSQHWQTLGGTLLKIQRYGADQRTHSNQVRDLLNIDASEQRHQALSRLLGRQPEFEPRRRQDADFLFLIASATQARLIRPLLRFHRASQLPVYTTSQVHEGTENPLLDADLDGLRFCDMPWVMPESSDPALRDAISQLRPAQEQRYGRLYAMGIDAFQLAPYLRGQQTDMFQRHRGVTGDLTLDSARRVHRGLQWGEYRKGRVVALPPNAPSMPLQDDDGTTDPNQPQELMDDYPAPTAAEAGSER